MVGGSPFLGRSPTVGASGADTGAATGVPAIGDDIGADTGAVTAGLIAEGLSGVGADADTGLSKGRVPFFGEETTVLGASGAGAVRNESQVKT